MSSNALQIKPNDINTEYIRIPKNEEDALRDARVEKADKIKNKFKHCKPGQDIEPESGKAYWKLFEEYCEELLRLVLSEDFDPLELDIQDKDYMEIDGRMVKGTRKDIVFYISSTKKDQDKSSQWDQLTRRGFETIVFDCKNIADYVRPQYLLQMYSYMVKGKSIGVIICNNDRSEPFEGNISKLAYKQLQKDGYPIIILNRKGINDWLDSYIEYGTSSEYVGSVFKKRVVANHPILYKS